MSDRQKAMDGWLEKYHCLIGRGLETVGEKAVDEAIRAASEALGQLDEQFAEEARGGEPLSKVELIMNPVTAKLLTCWAAYGMAALHQRIEEESERIL